MTNPNPLAQQRIYKPSRVIRVRLTEKGIRNLQRIQNAEQARTGRSISPSVAIDISLHQYT